MEWWGHQRACSAALTNTAPFVRDLHSTVGDLTRATFQCWGDFAGETVHTPKINLREFSRQGLSKIHLNVVQLSDAKLWKHKVQHCVLLISLQQNCLDVFHQIDGRLFSISGYEETQEKYTITKSLLLSQAFPVSCRHLSAAWPAPRPFLWFQARSPARTLQFLLHFQLCQQLHWLVRRCQQLWTASSQNYLIKWKEPVISSSSATKIWARLSRNDINNFCIHKDDSEGYDVINKHRVEACKITHKTCNKIKIAWRCFLTEASLNWFENLDTYWGRLTR